MGGADLLGLTAQKSCDVSETVNEDKRNPLTKLHTLTGQESKIIAQMPIGETMRL